MGYYSARLAGERLRRCYDVAPPRVRRYLQAEIDHVRDRLTGVSGVALELGCGYGRIARDLARPDLRIVGIDSAVDSLVYDPCAAGEDSCATAPPAQAGGYLPAAMDAARLGLRDGCCDAVLCLQNGACAFGVDQDALLREAARVCRRGGLLLFSSYAEGFWPHRLHWFRIQADAGLVGPIDEARTRRGVIACRDGFCVGFLRPEDFAALFARAGLAPTVREVDGSVTFCEARRS